MSFYGRDTDLRSHLLEGWQSSPSWSLAGTDLFTLSSDNSLNTVTTSIPTLAANSWIYILGFADARSNGAFRVLTSSANKLTLASGRDVADVAVGSSVSVQTLRTPIAWPNVSFTAPEPGESPWLRATIHGGVTTTVELEARQRRTYRARGLVLLDIYTEVGTGEGAGAQLADHAASIFRDPAPSGLYFAAPWPLPAGIDVGDGWWVRTLTIPFWHDTRQDEATSWVESSWVDLDWVK